MVRRISVLGVGAALVLLIATPVLARSSKASLDGARQSIQQVPGPQEPVGAVPEPGAALLFAAGAGSVMWALRRRTRR
jgi:hypothetical protein